MFDQALLYPAVHLSPGEALQQSKQAVSILENTKGAVAQSLLASPETPELWTVYENLLVSCLRTGKDESAREFLSRLVSRFGDDNERIMAFKGLVEEAVAADDAALNEVLKEYESALEVNPANIPIRKRRAALLQSMGRTSDAVSALKVLLDISPTDAEAWAEIADLYLAQGLYSQAIFALEGVLVLQPNAWNIHARLGEILLMATKASDGPKRLADALKRFSRSVELCDNYLRGYYGIKLTVQQLLNEPSTKNSKQAESDEWPVPPVDTLLKLDELATQKLAEIVRRYSAGDKEWQGYDEAEITAARELLAAGSAAITR